MESTTETIIENVEEVTEPCVSSEEEISVEAEEESLPEEVSKENSTNDRDRLEALREHERVFNEYREFSSLFPEANLASLPDSVNESVRAGVPLSAAYALYRYKKEAAEKAASTVNERNRERSFAVKRNDSSDSYFSPAEVKEMSPAEVKANYNNIIDSMSHWH